MLSKGLCFLTPQPSSQQTLGFYTLERWFSYGNKKGHINFQKEKVHACLKFVTGYRWTEALAQLVNSLSARDPQISRFDSLLFQDLKHLCDLLFCKSDQNDSFTKGFHFYKMATMFSFFLKASIYSLIIVFWMVRLVERLELMTPLIRDLGLACWLSLGWGYCSAFLFSTILAFYDKISAFPPFNKSRIRKVDKQGL